MPGPGNYEGNYTVGKRGAPKVQFGTIAHETSVKKNDQPGPGSYESPNKLGKRGLTMHALTSSQGRILSQDNEIAKNTPGPGSYSVNNRQTNKGGAPSAPSFSMGTLRPGKNNDNPAPG